MRLIDVDALKADYGMADDCKDCKTGWRSCQGDNTYTKMDFCGWLDDAPTVDAAPVVRCNECIRFHPDDDVWGWCAVDGKMRCKDYCSYGVRKDGDRHD